MFFLLSAPPEFTSGFTFISGVRVVHVVQLHVFTFRCKTMFGSLFNPICFVGTS